MKLRHWLSAAAGAVALGAVSMSAQAAPLGSAAGVNSGSDANSLVQDVARRCWRHRGHWHCRGDGYRRHYYNDGYGYGPGFSLYFGGGHRHGHHRHRHHRH
jgi:hypothetical protein